MKKMLFIVLSVLLATIAQATVIIDDSFDGAQGSSLNSAYWVANASNYLNGDGTAYVGSGTFLIASSSTDIAPTASEFVRATIEVTNAAWNAGYGLGNVYLRDDYGDGIWHVNIGSLDYATSGGKNWNWGGPTANTIQIDWYTDKVVIVFDGSQIFDSSVNGSGWAIQTTPAHLALGAAYGSWDLTHVVFETVNIPEPATISLLILGGLGLLRRKK
jgi:hypothetical protein